MRYTFKNGQHPTDVIEEAIVKFLANSDEKDDPKIKLHLHVIEAKEQDRDFAYLRNLTWRAMNQRSEDQMDMVKSMCDANEVNFETVLTSAQESEVEPITYENYNGVSAAKAWLIEHMQSGLDYKSIDMSTLAKEHGFSKNITESAKRSLGIRSVRKGDSWYWIR
jgi:hypothetical protein